MIATVLLLTSDPSLVATMREAVSTVSQCKLICSESLVRAANLGPQGPAIIFCHRGRGAGHDIKALVQQAASLPLKPALVALSDEFDPARAVTMLQQGAADCLSRPLDLGRIAMLTDFLTWRARQLPVDRAPGRAVDGVDETTTENPFLHWPEELAEIAEQVRTLAPLDTTVLLTGESGTGKTRLARLIHETSPRRDKPFAAVNCGSLTQSLVESELFGHVKSAFTGAEHRRLGKFGAAADGTLMLDEIDSLPPETQSKLLRAVDERMYESVGSDEPQPVEARIIAATNRCLESEVQAGRFRLDLFYRINVVTIHLPPLRERRQMILPLFEQWAETFAQRLGRPAPHVEAEAMRALVAYDWPGNIRELRNVVERSVTLCRNRKIGLGNLPPAIAGAFKSEAQTTQPPVSKLSASRQSAEFSVIQQALASHGNNRSLAARELGISRVTLYKKLHKYGLMLTGDGERQVPRQGANKQRNQGLTANCSQDPGECNPWVNTFADMNEPTIDLPYSFGK